jgi:hypothetical protein
VSLLRGHRKRALVTIGVVVGVLVVFAVQWAAAPRVKIDPVVAAQLDHVPQNALYLGETFEGLPLRSVEPFVYSDCLHPSPKLKRCHWLRVDGDRVTGSDGKQVERARKELHPVSADRSSARSADLAGTD